MSHQAAVPFLTLSPVRDRNGNAILLLHSDALPPALSELPAPEAALLNSLALQPEIPHTLVYLHAGLASTTPAPSMAVSAFRIAYADLVPSAARSAISSIVAVHVSFATRALAYANAFGSLRDEYARLTYCDLLEDVEKELGVEATVLGLRDVDFEYDDEMRAWVDRTPEGDAPASDLAAGQGGEKVAAGVDPSKPLLHFENVSFLPGDAADLAPDAPVDPAVDEIRPEATV